MIQMEERLQHRVIRVYRHLRILEIGLARFILLCPMPTQTWGKNYFQKNEYLGICIQAFLSVIVKYTKNGISLVGNRLLCRH